VRIFLRLFFLCLLFGTVTSHAQIFLNADSTGDAYTRIASKLYGYEVPDCIHPVIHILEPWDSFLKEYVFSFNIHKFPDNDRCINFDRQRVEIKTWDQSPDSMKFYYGDTLVDRWKFKLDAGFQPSSKFTHIHQIKAGDGTYDTDNPLMTFTARYASPNRLELNFTAPIEDSSTTTMLTKVNLAPFLGTWVEAYEKVVFGTSGSYQLTIKRVSDDSVYLSYSKTGLYIWRDSITFCRPKYGIYRSLDDSTKLRDESVLFADFSLKKGATQTVPANPTLLHSTAVKPVQAPLAWTDNSGNELLFRIDRSTNGSSYTFLGYTQAGVTAFTDTGLTPSTTYYYRVRSENQVGNSGYATVTYTTSNGIPIAPTGLTSSSIGANRVVLSWTDNSSDESLFRVERSLNGSTYSSIGTTSANVTSYTDSGLTSATTYYYRVRAENKYGNSSYSTYSVSTLITEPTIQTSGIQFTAVNDASEKISFTAGNGSRRLLLVRAGSSVTSNPVDNTTYTANSAFGSGTQIGTGNYVVYADTGKSVTLTGLTAGIRYYINAYEFNGSGGSENYLTSNPATGSFAIAIVEPAVQASNVVISSVTASAMSISCTKGSGSRRIFVMRSSASSSVSPNDSTTYTSNSIFGSGGVTGTGNYVVYSDTGSSVTVTGLAQLTTYYVNVYEYNGIGGTENYLTVSPASNSATTLFNGITSTATGGLWSNASSWTGGSVPGSSDNVLIASGATVTLSSAVTVLSTTIASGGKLSIGAASTLNGNIICNGAIAGSSYALTTNGNLTVSGTSASFTFSSNTGKVIQTAARTFTLANGATFEHAANGVSPLDSVMRVSGGAWTWVIDNSINNTTVSYKNSSNTTVITALPSGQTYGNLIIKSPSTSASSDWVNKLGASLTILGNFSIQNTTAGASGAKNMGFNLSGFTLTGNNANSSFTFSNTTSGAAATIRLISSSTGKVTADFAASFPGFTSVSFSSTGIGTDTIPGGTYTNVAFSGTGTKLTNANMTVNGSLTMIGGGLTLGSGKTLSYASLAGVIYNGTAAQTTGSELPASINSLTINNASGVTLNTSVTVNSTLNLTSGKLTLGTYNLTVGGSISGTFSSSTMVASSGTGELRKIFSSLPASFTYPVGTGSIYSPVSLTLNSGTLSSAYIGVKVVAQKSANNSSAVNYLNRTWTLTSNGITNPVYSDTLQYAAGDVAGTESILYGGLYSSAAWKNLGAVDAVNHYVMGNNVTAFGDFTAGENSAFPSSGFVNVKVIPQGYYNTGGYLNMSDTVKVLLANASSPYAFIDSVSTVLDSLSFTALAEFKNVASGNYYLVIKHRNCVETWSAAAVSFTKGSTTPYDFTNAQSKAYGNNLVQVSASPELWAMYSGDINQDGYVDPLDLSLVDQDSYNYVSGRYVATDVNGDGYVDPLDLSIVDQNSFDYVGVQKPVSGKHIRKNK
jgi:hypothetical protein